MAAALASVWDMDEAAVADRLLGNPRRLSGSLQAPVRDPPHLA